MNKISPYLVRGTFGELLVQLRLLQFGVQSAPPIKDSGNDLIAVRHDVFRAVQVKSTATNKYPVGNLPEFYHILAVVHLAGEDSNLLLDRSRVFLIPKECVPTASRQIKRLDEFALCKEYVDVLFGARHFAHTGPITQ